MRVFAERASFVPLSNCDQVDCDGRSDALETCLRQSDVAASAQAAPTNRLRIRAIDAGARGIALPKLLRCLISSSRLQYANILAGQQRNERRRPSPPAKLRRPLAKALRHLDPSIPARHRTRGRNRNGASIS